MATAAGVSSRGRFISVLVATLALIACGPPAEDAASERDAFQEGLEEAAKDHDGSPSTSGQAAGLKPTCSKVSYPTRDPEATAQKLIEAVQQRDQAAVCANIGRADVPDGLLRYADALDQGLAPEVKFAGRMVDPKTSQDTLRFQVGAEGSQAILGFAFQKQEQGWVLLMAPFLG